MTISKKSIRAKENKIMGYTCTVKKGNLLIEQDATFIVNASNTILELGSGVSAAFRKKSGIALQREMLEKYKSLEQRLDKGDVIATSAGDANNFKYALHAAVMDYNRGVRGIDKLPTIGTIAKVLNNIEPYLKWYADNHKNERMKLVLPLMGCGVGGLDKVAVVELYHDFFRREVFFECEVVVYGYTQEDYELIKQGFNF